MLTTTYPLADAGTGTVVLMLLLGLALGGAATWAYTWWQAKRETSRQRAAAAKAKAEAEQQAADILKAAEVSAQKKHIEALQRFEAETAETRAELKAAERRLAKREDALDKKLEVLTTKERKIELAEQKLAEREREIEQKNAAADEAVIQQKNELLRIARLTPEQAKQLCLQRIEGEVEREAGELVDRIISHAEENAREKARYITITAIQRYAAEHTCETTVATVDVPSDDMKGRIIGREGRNIRAFEKSTGATVIVDDTPGIVSVSCMDPVRKEVARLSLDRLIRDGRIHPTRIEELVAEVTKEVDQRIIEAGKAAAAEVNVQGIHKKIIETLGRLQYRTSYGQNVLRHSIEVSFLCGMMADELGLEGPLARRCALLHDIGKALDHEHEGAHTRTGYEFARRFNEPPAVLNAIIGHHGDVAATHPYTPLVAAADAISAARPGGRRESLERYIKRLQDLENIATSFSGVDLAYAIEAGREVRVIVDASSVDDSAALKLARDVANKIEQDMVTFPGEIKVTVLRELRATEYAISGRHRSNGSANAS
ncbi:MAG: ribonuclease Y [Phycisphaerae bacterium]|mgnify:FL=1|nr:ribonuclease Y [Phycisphaerae bacterium]